MGHILTLNAGSSSLKFALLALGNEPEELLSGQLEGLGTKPRLVAKTKTGETPVDRRWSEGEGPKDHATALAALWELLEREFPAVDIVAVGHRVVHGGPRFSEPLIVEAAEIDALREYVPLAPLHQPHNLAGIDAARAALPRARQVACFDTAFHRSHPWINDVYALPRRYYEAGVRRYGFHGLSYEYVVSTLASTRPALLQGRLVVAHLGNGASMCAIHGGKPVASTLGFSALDGLPMGTRCGQLDPGIILYMLQAEGLDAKAIQDVLYKESGLKGLSGLSNDMRTLEESDTPEALGAIAYFCARIRRELGGLAAAMGGIDGVVFTGGIGENSRRVRALACADLDFLGIRLDPDANAANAAEIGAADACCPVLVVNTNEEAMIARHTARLIG
ncbi:MAG: acetate/propionate family kinase [Geminicoccaceae bacterium]|nr:MAG: acetate/propionate family kinase [Geminicoccaceae bacterium]